ncbi:Protein transport protein sec31 [Ceratobasidium theobromae]|uniref:Protein transport protein sec31 n=1 Tax=Ceratobasidium theobromae TaxID=1582974 RepID=A0A5N5QCM0_9AGAM|nr:Protein transport protein sec31 [Ceratobasidium theobromae]
MSGQLVSKDLNVTAPEFIPKTISDLNAFAEVVAPEDALSTPTPTSVSSFTQLVKSARAALDGSDVSMMSMTDDDSEISSADVSLSLEPKTPCNIDHDELDVSPTGGLGGGVRCGVARIQEPPEPKGIPRFKEGLIPMLDPPRPKYRPFPPQRSCNIHIQNLPEHYGDAELTALCEEFGHVVSVRVLRRTVAAPPNRRLPDGQQSTYGFVLFDNIIAAENCVNTLRRRYKNIYPSFARQTAPAVHQPAFVGLLEAMAFGDLHSADPNTDGFEYWNTVNPGLGEPPYGDTGMGSVYPAPAYEAPRVVLEAPPPDVRHVFEVAPQVQPTLVSAPLESQPARSRALTIKPMPPPIQSCIPSSTTTDRINSALNQSSILLIVDGLPKDFGVGLLDTLFAPHPIHDVRLYRKGPSGAVRGSVRQVVSSRLAALQSIEKLTGMQFGGLANGLVVRLAEEVPGGSDLDAAAPALPSYRTLPDVQEYQSTLAPPINALASSTSAPAVASMIGSGLNALLFASESCADGWALGSQMAAPAVQVSPSTGRFLGSPARLQVPSAPPGLPISVSMPQVAPRFFGQGQAVGLSPSLRVGNVTLPISNVLPSDNTLYACSNIASSNLLDQVAGTQVTPEPPVIKVTSYAGAVKKPIVTIDTPKDGADARRKRKGSRATKGRGKHDASKSSPELAAKSSTDVPAVVAAAMANQEGVLAAKEGTLSAQPKSTSATSKAKRWLSTRRRVNSKSTATKA